MIKGIDISSNNSSLDIAYAKQQGIQYCYIKATEGKSYINPYIDKQYRDAKNAGMKIGFYHFANGNSSAETQADFFKSVIVKYGQDLMPCLDIEAGFVGNATDFTVNFINALGGKDKAIIYTGLSFYHERINIKGYKIWVAAYGQSKPSMKDNYMVGWQYSDSGLNGCTDMSEWYGDISIESETKTVVANYETTQKQNYKEEMYVEVKTFCNGSTRENIYSSNKHDNLVGYLDPGEVCDCLGTHNGHAIVMYDASNGYSKIGFTESTVWPGCIK